MTPPFVPGYHLRPIPKGVLGEPSKIREELDEYEEAIEQEVTIMALVELADLYGAMEALLEKHLPTVSMDTLSQACPLFASHPDWKEALILRQAVEGVEATWVRAGAEPAEKEAAVTELYRSLSVTITNMFHPLFLGMGDLARMAAVTRRAFANGRRT
jgi:hypothetical protein